MYPQVINPGIYSFTRWGWKNPKSRFWHFEPWFLKVLKFSKNMFLYITAGSFGSGGGGLKGKVFISASGAVGEGCDPTIIPPLRMAAMLCGDQVLVCTPGRCRNRDGHPLLHQPLPPPPPKPSSQTDLLN